MTNCPKFAVEKGIIRSRSCPHVQEYAAGDRYSNSISTTNLGLGLDGDKNAVEKYAIRHPRGRSKNVSRGS